MTNPIASICTGFNLNLLFIFDITITPHNIVFIYYNIFFIINDQLTYYLT
ncbi:hypothetical protein CLO_1764 [Clostridium botulinum E1 str. 'BoNT E Beluga']|nr:hypothetical protein CLO_1764 [Clostridium botulinum E1 str. 'BoNT E Beluga']